MRNGIGTGSLKLILSALAGIVTIACASSTVCPLRVSVASLQDSSPLPTAKVQLRDMQGNLIWTALMPPDGAAVFQDRNCGQQLQLHAEFPGRWPVDTLVEPAIRDLPVKMESLTMLSLSELLNDPARHNGALVMVRGFLVCEPDLSGLFVSADDFKHSIFVNGIGFRPEAEPCSSRMDLNHTPVTVIGRVDSRSTATGGGFSATLTDLRHITGLQ